MAAKELVRLFNPESFGGGGGSFFANGLYRIEEARFVRNDFGGQAPGKAGNGIVALQVQLQPVDKDGKDIVTDTPVNPQLYGLGDDISIENKGKSIALIGDYSVVFQHCDYAYFVDALGKAKFDRNAMDEENDISVLDGTVAEWALVPHPNPQKKPRVDKKTGKEYPPTAIYPIQLQVKSSGKGAASSKTAAAASKANGLDAGDLLSEYVATKVVTDKNEKNGIERFQAQMGINGFVRTKGGDPEMMKAVTGLFKDNDVLIPLLESHKWTLEGSTIKGNG